MTENALQEDWRIPSEFPLCPKQISDNPLNEYFLNIHKGDVFCKNSVYESIVHLFELSEDNKTLAVVTSSDHVKGVSGFCLATITYEEGKFIHKNEGSYFHEDSAIKYMTLALGKEWTGGDVFDDYC